MSGDKSNSFGPERDFLCQGPSACLLWGAPWVAFALGFGAPPGLRTVLWTTSLAFMGVACLVNASRCGRIHCRFTGPFFILGALTSLGYGLDLLPFGPSGWKWIGAVTIIGAIALTCIPEVILGRYRRNRRETRPNQSVKPTASLRYNFSAFATAPCRGLSLSR
jgi:hypothetical protein